VPQSTAVVATSAAAGSTAKASATSSSSSASGQKQSGSFTVPAIVGDNVASGTGTYTRLGADRVQVHVCVSQTGAAFAVGIEALAYNSAGKTDNVGAVVQTGPGHSACGTLVFLFYTAHLKVHTFIGTGGNITKTSPVISVY
jgi:hypothetical protein